MIKRLIVILSLAISANAANYFVKPTGSDAAAGTSDGTAWQTIAKVNSFTFAAGDTISFKTGTYGCDTDAILNIGQAGSAGLPITVQAYSGAVIFDAHNAATRCIDINKDYITIDLTNITVQNSNTTSNGMIRVSGASAATHVTIKNGTIKNAGNQGVGIRALAGSANLLIDGVHITKDAGTLFDHGIYVIGTGSDNLEIKNSTVDALLATSGIFVIDVNNALIHNNTITGNGIGIACNAVTADLTTACQVYDNKLNSITNTSQTDPQSNVHSRDGESIECTGNAAPLKFAKCLFYRNTCIGNNSTTVDCTGGQDTQDSEIYDNLCLGIKGNCHHWSTSGPPAHPVNFHNNSSYMNQAGDHCYSITSSVAGYSVTIRNDVCKKNSSNRWIDIDSNVTVSYDHTDLAGSGSAACGGGGTCTDNGSNLSSDPQFTVDPPTDESGFKLKVTSPNVDSGANLGAPYNLALDPHGNSSPFNTADQGLYGSAWERGAFAFIPANALNVQIKGATVKRAQIR